MQCFTSCWRLVDWQKDLASRGSSILMELCFSWRFFSSPGQSRHSPLLLRVPQEIFLWPNQTLPLPLHWRAFLVNPLICKQMRSRLCILETIKPLKMILDSAMASKMKNIYHKKLNFFTQKMVFIQKKLHGLSEEPNPFVTQRDTRFYQLFVQKWCFSCLERDFSK